MQITKLLARNTILNLVGYLYLLVASFFSIPMLSRGLGGQLFAQYLLLAAIPPIMSVFDLGVSQAVIRELSSNSRQNEQLTRRASYLFFLINATILAIITFAVVALIGTSPLFTGTQMRTLVILTLAGSVFINQLMTHFLSLAQAQSRFDIFNIKTFVVGTGNTLLAGVAALRTGQLLPVFVILFLSYLLTLALVVYTLDHGRSFWERPLFNLKALRSLLDYGLRSFVGKLGGQLELHAGKYALAGLSGLAVTAFSIPQLIMYRSAGAISQCALALFPLSSSLADPAKRHKLRTLYYRLQSGILGLSIFGVILAHTIGEPFLTWWLADPMLVTSAYPILRILSFFFVLLALTPVASTIVDSLGYPHLTSLFGISNATLNIILLLVLVPRYQALGAAYAITISMTLMVPLFLLYTERLLQSNKLRY